MASIVKVGADASLTLPLIRDELLLLTEDIKRGAHRKDDLEYFTDHFWNRSERSLIETQNCKMQEVFANVIRVAEKKTNVLLTGETGVGKNVIAHTIHEHSDRKKKPFVSVHCGAIPASLIESELFGHEKGAFTGATKKKLGKFELANGGTIFLDEIGTMTLSAQIKILQIIQDSTFQRVGGEADIKLDIRIIAATNIDIAEHVKKGKFREDLYYRINVFPIKIPPLRERPEDIPRLLNFFLTRYKKLYHCQIEGYSTDVLYAATNYDWPGNIRELENLVERACIVEKSNNLELSSFPVLESQYKRKSVVEVDNLVMPLMEARQKVVDDFEKTYFENRLSENKGQIKAVSEAAGIGTRQTHKLLAKYGLHADTFRKK